MSLVQFTVKFVFGAALLCLCCVRITLAGSRYNNQPRYSIEKEGSSDWLLKFDSNIVKERNVRDITPTPQSTEFFEDNHNYYDSRYFNAGANYYIDLETEEPYFSTITHAGLSSAHLKAAMQYLPLKEFKGKFKVEEEDVISAEKWI